MVGGILLFWVAVAVALTIVLLVLSVPFALFRFGAPGLPIAGLIWTIVGPLAFLNAALYGLVRAGTVIVDHYRSGEGLTFEPGRSSDGASESAADAEADRTAEPDGDDDETGDDGAAPGDAPPDPGDDGSSTGDDADD